MVDAAERNSDDSFGGTDDGGTVECGVVSDDDIGGGVDSFGSVGGA